MIISSSISIVPTSFRENDYYPGHCSVGYGHVHFHVRNTAVTASLLFIVIIIIVKRIDIEIELELRINNHVNSTKNIKSVSKSWTALIAFRIKTKCNWNIFRPLYCCIGTIDRIIQSYSNERWTNNVRTTMEFESVFCIFKLGRLKTSYNIKTMMCKTIWFV